MAIEYQLRCDFTTAEWQRCIAAMTECGLTEVERRLVKLGRWPGAVEEDTGELIAFDAYGLDCSVFPESRLGRSIMRDAFGVDPKLQILFRLDAVEGLDTGMSKMTRVCVVILKGTSGDCVLLANGDTPILLRKGGRVVLQADPNWAGLTSAIAGFSNSFTFEPLPVI